MSQASLSVVLRESCDVRPVSQVIAVGSLYREMQHETHTRHCKEYSCGMCAKARRELCHVRPVSQVLAVGFLYREMQHKTHTRHCKEYSCGLCAKARRVDSAPDTANSIRIALAVRRQVWRSALKQNQRAVECRNGRQQGEPCRVQDDHGPCHTPRVYICVWRQVIIFL